MNKVFTSLTVGLVAIFLSSIEAMAQPSGIDQKKLVETKMVRLLTLKKLDSALIEIDRWVEIAKKNNDEHLLAKGWFYHGLSSLMKGQNENATIEFNKVLSSKLEWNDPPLLFKTLHNLGLAHKRMSNLSVASSYLHQALELPSQGIPSTQLAFLHDVLGNIQSKLENYDLAFDYHLKALATYAQIADSLGLAKVYTNLSNTFYNYGDYDSALYYSELALHIRLKKGPVGKLGINYTILGKVFLALDSVEVAGAYLRKALDTSYQLTALDKGYAYLHLADVYLHQGKYDSVQMAVSKGFLLAGRTKSKDLQNTLLGVQTDMHEEQENYSAALKTMSSQLALGQEILDEAKQRALTELEIQYQVRQTQSELIRQKQAWQLANAKVETQRLQLLTLLLTTAIVLLLAISWWRGRNKQRSLKENKEALLRELSHRVKNNHSALSGAISVQMANTLDTPVLNALEEHSRRIEAINLLHINLSLDDGATTQVDFSEYIDKLTKSVIFSSVWGDEIEPKLELEDVSLRMDKAIPLGMMVNELLINACKYAFTSTSKNKSILVRVSYTQDLVIEIHDNGIGMRSEMIPSQSKTTGMMIIHGLASQLKARLHFENKDGLLVRITMKK